MKKAIKITLFVLLSFITPYIVMLINGSFTLKAYGNVLCYIGMAHILIGLASWQKGVSVGDRTAKGHIFSSNLYNDLRDPNENPKTLSGTIIIPLIFEIVGAGTVYFGYMLTNS